MATVLQEQDSMDTLLQLQAVYEETPGEAEPAMETPEYMNENWGGMWGVNNDVGQIKKVLVHRPGIEIEAVNRESVINQAMDARLAPNGKKWYWLDASRPLDLERMQEQHDNMCDALRKEGCEVIYLDAKDEDMLRTPGKKEWLTKVIYTRDPFICVPGGAIILRMAPYMRHGEERVYTKSLANIGIPILATLHGNAIAEGGSFTMITPDTAAIGVSNRINEEGANQIESILNQIGVRLLKVPLCGWNIHIDLSFCMVDRDLAVIDPRTLPWWFLCELKEMGIRTVYGHPDEFWACNMLATRPGRVIIAKGSERTGERLAKEGVEIAAVVEMDEIWRGGGSVHCSTQPLMREYF